MDKEKNDPSYQTPRELAGALYDQMIRSKEATLACLASPDYRVCIAAIMLCESTWKCCADRRVIKACRTIVADSTADDSLRICVIGLLGMILMSSKEFDTSQFLANVVMNSNNSIGVRTAAYWSLRQLQYGLADVDFDTFLKGTISSIKSILRENPRCFSENKVKSEITPKGRFPEGFWESVDEIDWSFVAQFTSVPTPCKKNMQG